MRGKSPPVIKAKGYGNSRLESREYPNFHPATLCVKIPRENYTGLKDSKDVRPTGHCTIDILSRLPRMIIWKQIVIGTVNYWNGDTDGNTDQQTDPAAHPLVSRKPFQVTNVTPKHTNKKSILHSRKKKR